MVFEINLNMQIVLKIYKPMIMFLNNKWKFKNPVLLDIYIKCVFDKNTMNDLNIFPELRCIHSILI